MKADTIRRPPRTQEYKGPDLLYGLPAGGVLLVDLGNARLSFFDAALKYANHLYRRGKPLTSSPWWCRTASTSRSIYFRSMMRNPNGSRGDSGAVLRWSPPGEKFDTVGKVKLGEVKVKSSGGPNSRSMSMQGVPYSPEDVWGVAPDGRIAIVRAADYHLEWLTPGSPVVRGPAVAARPVGPRR
jgi:hypothetical protein